MVDAQRYTKNPEPPHGRAVQKCLGKPCEKKGRTKKVRTKKRRTTFAVRQSVARLSYMMCIKITFFDVFYKGRLTRPSLYMRSRSTQYLLSLLPKALRILFPIFLCPFFFLLLHTFFSSPEAAFAALAVWRPGLVASSMPESAEGAGAVHVADAVHLEHVAEIGPKHFAQCASCLFSHNITLSFCKTIFFSCIPSGVSSHPVSHSIEVLKRYMISGAKIMPRGKSGKQNRWENEQKGQ